MGDDERRGPPSGPGGRAPWERYPAPESADEESSGRRSRHTDDASGSDPVTVHDLVQRERGGRRRQRAPEPPEAPPPSGPPARSGPNVDDRPTDTVAPPGAGPGKPPPPRTPAPDAPATDPVETVAPAKPVAPGPPPGGRAPGGPPPGRPATGGRKRVPGRPVDPVTDKLPVAGAEPPPPATPNEDTPSAAGAPKGAGGSPRSRLALSKQRRQRRMGLIGRSAAAFVAVLALLITGVGWNYLRVTNNGFNQISALDLNSNDIVDQQAQYGDENFLIVGSDTRSGADGQLGAGSADDAEGARADTMMLVHIPQDRKRVVAVSFPRDLDVSRPDCEGWDDDKAQYNGTNFPGATGEKLNAAYAIGGPKCLNNTLTKMSGLKINHFVAIDFGGFQSMVDTVGGVEVCTARPLVDEELGTVLPNPGRQVVNGSTALDYVRARHVNGEERSDYDRIHRQQLFLSSLLRSVLSSKVLFDVGKLTSFVNAFGSHTMMDGMNTNDLLTLGRSLQKVDAGAITFLTIPTSGTNSYGNEIPRDSDIQAMFSAIRDDQPLPGEKQPPAPAPPPPPAPAATAPMTAVDPGSVSVQVSNGSGQSGTANTTASQLSNQGFQIYNVGNYASGTSQTTKVRYPPGMEAEASTVASAIPGATLESTSEAGSIVELVLGSDFTGTVDSPTPFGDQLPQVATAPAADGSGEPLPDDLEHVNAGEDPCQ